MNTDDKIINKYIIKSIIGEGKFGKVYKAYNIKNEEFVAIKLEDKRTSYNLLKRETTILKYLYERKCRNIPMIYWFGPHNNYTTLVMSYYEISLYDYFQVKAVSISKINNIMIKCINILENIHNLFVIHRDIKPQNFMIKNGEIFLIDFGLASYYITDEQIHISNKIGEHIIGTPKYISTNIHNGYTPSRRDDIISLGYIFIFLFNNELPWDNITLNDEELLYPNPTHILNSFNVRRKNLKSIENLIHICENINTSIVNYFKITYNIDYHITPPYNSLCSLFLI